MFTTTFAQISTRIITIAAALPLALAAPAAFAAAPSPEDAPVQVSVGYGDLNLGSAKGQTVLNHRISRAADEACAGALSLPDRIDAMTTYAQCRKVAINGARQQLATKAFAGNLAAR